MELSELAQPERIEFIKGAFAVAAVWVGKSAVRPPRKRSSKCCSGKSHSHRHTHSHRH